MKFKIYVSIFKLFGQYKKRVWICNAQSYDLVSFTQEGHKSFPAFLLFKRIFDVPDSKNLFEPGWISKNFKEIMIKHKKYPIT